MKKLQIIIEQLKNRLAGLSLAFMLLFAFSNTFAQQSLRYDPIRIWGRMAIGKNADTNPDSSALLDLGVYGGKKGLLLQPIYFDSMTNAKYGDLGVDIRTKRLTYFDSTKKRYVLTLDDSGIYVTKTFFNANNGVPDTSRIATHYWGQSTFVPLTRKLTINGTQLDLSADRSWTIPTVTSLSALTDANISSPTNGQILQYQSSDSKWHNWTPTYIGQGDTSNMLLNYKNNLAALNTDTATLGTRFGYKVNYSDTSTMLGGYVRDRGSNGNIPIRGMVGTNWFSISGDANMSNTGAFTIKGIEGKGVMTPTSAMNGYVGYYDYSTDSIKWKAISSTYAGLPDTLNDRTWGNGKFNGNVSVYKTVRLYNGAGTQTAIALDNGNAYATGIDLAADYQIGWGSLTGQINTPDLTLTRNAASILGINGAMLLNAPSGWTNNLASFKTNGLQKAYIDQYGGIYSSGGVVGASSSSYLDFGNIMAGLTFNIGGSRGSINASTGDWTIGSTTDKSYRFGIVATNTANTFGIYGAATAAKFTVDSSGNVVVKSGSAIMIDGGVSNNTYAACVGDGWRFYDGGAFSTQLGYSWFRTFSTYQSFNRTSGFSIGNDVGTNDASALVQIFSTTKGFLVPAMTNTQLNAIASPIEGLEVHDNTNKQRMLRLNGAWNSVLATTGYTAGSLTQVGYVTVSIGGTTYKLMVGN